MSSNPHISNFINQFNDQFSAATQAFTVLQRLISLGHPDYPPSTTASLVCGLDKLDELEAMILSWELLRKLRVVLMSVFIIPISSAMLCFSKNLLTFVSCGT